MRKLLALSLVVAALFVVGFAAGQLRGATAGHAAGLSHANAAVMSRTVQARASTLAVSGEAVASLARAHASSGRFVHAASIARTHAYSGGSRTTKTYASTTHHCDHAGGSS